jgi:hypothetical protein
MEGLPPKKEKVFILECTMHLALQEVRVHIKFAEVGGPWSLDNQRTDTSRPTCAYSSYLEQLSLIFLPIRQGAIKHQKAPFPWLDPGFHLESVPSAFVPD